MESGRSGSCGYAAGPARGGAHRPTGSRAIADKVERYAVAQAYQAFPNAGVYTAVSCLIQGIVNIKKRPAVFGEFKNTVMLGYALRIAHSAHKRIGQEPGQGRFISGDGSAEAVLRILRDPFFAGDDHARTQYAGKSADMPFCSRGDACIGYSHCAIIPCGCRRQCRRYGKANGFAACMLQRAQA